MAINKLPMTKIVWLITSALMVLALFFAAKDVWRSFVVQTDMGESAHLVDLSIALSAMVHEQQKERGASAVFLSSKGTEFGPELEKQRAVVDAQHKVALEKIALVKKETSSGDIETWLVELETRIAEVANVRTQINQLSMRQPDAVKFYTDLNQLAVRLVGFVATNVKDSDVSRELLTYRALMFGKDYSGIDRAIGASGFAVGAFDEGKRQKLIELPAKQSTFLNYVVAYGIPAQQEQMRAILQSETSQEIETMRTVALSGNEEAIATISASTWFDLQTKKIGELRALEESLGADIAAHIEERLFETQMSLLLMISMLVAGFAVSSWLSVKAAKAVKARVESVVLPISQLAEWQTNVSIPDHSSNEFAPVVKAMRVFHAAAIAKEEEEVERAIVLRTLRDSLTQMAGGNLERPIEQQFAEKYSGIRTDFNGAQATLRELIHQVVGSAQQITHGANEVNAAASDLSSRTARQAATLEETSAALQRANKGIQTSADLAQKTNTEVAKTRQNAMQNEKMVDATVDAMEQIQASFAEVEKITTVIQEIAFQTNILALNAGVEATRAGDAGKGFGVVATEVRALAQRSSEAVTSIQELMAKSSENIGNGSKQVTASGTALREMIQMIDSVGSQVEKLAEASTDSAQGLNEIDAALATLDLDTQQNASMAEESSAASSLLTQEVHKLNQQTSVFIQSDQPDYSGDMGDERLVA